MASFFDDFNEKKKKKKTTVQTVTPVKAVKAKQETKQATKTKTVSQAAKATVNKNKNFAKAYENKKKVSLPTVSKPSLPKQTMNGSLRTPVRAMGETKKRAAQNTAVETRRRSQQTLSAADKKLSPVQQRAVQTYKADWDAAEARGDRAAMNLAHQRAEDIRRQQGYSGGVAGNEYISPKISRQDRDLLNDSGQMAMKQAKLDFDRASAAGNTLAMKEAILEMTALRKGEKYRSMDMRPAMGTDAYGRPIYGKTQREQLMGEAMGKGVAGGLLSLRETANTALRNQARQRWTADKTQEMVNPNALGQRLMRESTMAGAMATQDLSGGKKLLAETAISMGQMLPGMAASAIPVVGPAIGAAMLSGQAAGAKAFELNERGVDPGEALTRGLISGGIEGLTEAIPLARLGKILTGSAGRSLVKNVLGQMGVEATEESIAYTANYLADKAFKDPEAEWTLQELGRNALAGAIAGGTLAGAGSLAMPSVGNETNVRKTVENVESGLVRDDYTSRQDQRAMDEIDAASKLMGVQVGFQARTPGGMPRTQGNQIILEQGTQAPARFMFGRQLAGWMEQAAPESYGQFKEIIRNEPGVQSQVKAIMEDAKELGMAYTEEQAMDQVAADYAGTLMENDGVLRSFTEKAKGNKPMLQQMSDGLRSLGQRLTGRQAQKAQNAAEALELAMHETIKGNRLLTGKEQRIKNRQMAQAQRWELDRRDAITERITEMYQDGHLPAAVRARVDQVGIEGMVDEYLNGNLPADLREFGRAIEVYEEQNRNYSFLRPEEYSNAIAEATEVARQLGLNLEMADQVAEGRANAEIEGNTVRIEKWNPNPVRFLFGHEMTHYLQEKTPDSYNQFRDHVMQTVGPDAVRNKIQEYADHGVELTTEEAIDEIVADYAGQLVENRDLLNKFIQDNRQNKTLLERVLEAIRNLAAKLTGKKKTQAEEAAALLEKAMQEVRGQVKQGTEVTTEASKQAKKLEKVGNASRTGMVYDDGNGHSRYSLKTYREGGRDTLGRWLADRVKAGDLDERDAKDMMKEMDRIYDICEKYTDVYAPFGKWSEAEVVQDDNGDPVFSVVKANGDYPMNMDFSLVCKKRRPLDAVLNSLVEQGLAEKFALDKESIVVLNDIIRRHGFETACSLCFVDAKRFRVTEVADQFSSMYNRLVRSMVPKGKDYQVASFNFGGDKTVKKVSGGIDTMQDGDLNFKEIEKTIRTTGEKSVAHKIAVHLRDNPADRKLVRRGDFISTAGFDRVKKDNPALLSLYNSKKGSAGPKASFSDVQYLSEVLEQKFFKRDAAYAVGGVRIQSFSDYMPRLFFDYAQMIADLSAKKLPAHGYTKEALFAQQFGQTGVKINLSLVPKVVEGGVAPGLDANGNYVWQEGQSFGSAVSDKDNGKAGFDLAVQIQNAEGYGDNCGTIAVGVSDRHIEKMLDDPDIRMIIPYHKSGLNPVVAAMNKIDKFENYTNYQNTRSKKTGKKVDAHFDFNTELQKIGDAKATADAYLAWCEENGYLPKFDIPKRKFFPSQNPNYYKLLIDFSAYNSDGKATPQGDVRIQYPQEGDAFGSLNDLIKQGLEEDALAQAKLDKGVKPILDDVEKELAKKPGARYSLKTNDQAYLAAVERGDMETAQKMVDDAAKAAGYTVETYHGTDKEFTVFETMYRNEFGYHVGGEKAAKSRVEFELNPKIMRLYTKLGKTIQTTDVFGYFAGMHDYIFYVRGEMNKIEDPDFIKQLGRKKKLRNKFPENEILEQMHSAYVDFHENGYKGSDARRVVELTQEYLKSIGVDSVSYKNAYEDAGSTSYLLLHPEQVKLADPVTYDDSGNVIPLSERFSEGNSDIRYSLKTTRRDTSGSEYERAYEMVYGKQGEPKTVEQAANQEAVGVIDRLQNLETPKPETKAKPLPKPGERKVEAVKEDPIPAEDLAYMDELTDAAVDPALEGEFVKLRKMISPEEEKLSVKDRAKEIGGYAYRKMVDSGDEIRKAGKQAGDKYLYYYYNNAKASTATAQNMITMRQTDVYGKEVGESLVDIFGPIKKKGKEYFKDFQEYLLHRHNIHRMGTKEERQMQEQATRYLWDFEDANPEYKGWTLPEIRDAADDGDALAKEYLDIKKEKAFWDSKVKPVFDYDMTPEKSRVRVGQYERKHPEFKDLAERVYAYNRNLMQYRVDSGLISKDTADYLQERYPDYVPTFHTQDGVNTAPQEKGTRVGKTVKKAVGNTKNNPFVDMDKAMAQQTMSVVRESAKNIFGNRLMNVMIPKDYIINVESLGQQKALAELHDEDGFKNDQTSKDNTFTVYQNGKAYEITMTPAMYEGIKSLSKVGEMDNLAIKAVVGANNFYKKAITSWNFIFTIKNFLKDMQDSLLYTTTSPGNFLKYYKKAVEEIRKGGDNWKLLQALGGTASSAYNMDRGVELPKDGAWAKLIGKIQYLNLAVEQAPRLAEFMATADKGNRTHEELMEAMYRAADITTNFGRSGDYGKAINRTIVPFFNPSIQGVDKLMRAFRDNPRKVGPWVSLIGRTAVLGVAPVIINAALFGDEEDYEELNQRDKDNNFMIPARLFNEEWAGLWVRVPRGRVLAAVGAFTNAGINLAQGKEVDRKDLIDTVISNIGVVNPLSGNILKAWMDTDLTDKDSAGKTWYGSNIESQAMQNKKPSERYDEDTSWLAKGLGKAVGLSPAKIDYLLDSYTGVFGDFILPLTTPTKATGRDPIKKAFVTDSTTSNRLSGDFYELGDKLKYAEQDGDTSATIAYDYWSKVSQELSEVNEEIRKMENDKGLDSKAKRKKYKDLKAKANEILRDGTANVEAFRKAAEEYDGEINEDTEWDVLVELTRDVLGAEKALEYDGKTTYEKAQEIVKEGGSYESYYDYLQAERVLNDIMGAESNLNTLTERNITGAKLTEAQSALDLLNEENKDLVEKSLEGSNGWKPTSTDRKMAVLESLELPEEEAFAIWKMKILDSEQRYKMEVLEEAGLPQMDYFRYKMAVKHMNGYEDSSEPGTTKRNSKKDMRVPIINSLDLTPAQKDILYLDVENWAKSGLYKTPWH